MARSFVLGGVSATGLATGKPYIRRITRIDGTATGSPPADGLTCAIDSSGNVSFRTDGSETDGDRKAWNAGAGGDEGELLFVEFPATTRTLSVQLEAAERAVDNTAAATANNNIRLKVMLTAPGQVVTALDANGVPTSSTDTMQPITNGNFIEIGRGDTATINARTKGVFILIQNFAGSTIFTDVAGDGSGGNTTAGLQVGAAANALDAVSILVTAVLDHEGFDKPYGVQSTKKSAANVDSNLTKIWPISTSNSDGVG